MARFPHKLDHTVTSTMNMGLLTPLVSMEAFPGDKLPITNKILARTLPQVGPTMHDVNFSVDYHEVPYRQIFDKMGLNWDNFLTGGVNGTDDTVYPTVTVPAAGWSEGSLADFLGLPANYIAPATGNTVVVGAGLVLNAMVVLGYIHVWNTYYCDHNFVAEIPLTPANAQSLLDGTYVFMLPDGVTPLGYSIGSNGILPKAWRRDYFGRMLPNTQRGPEVKIPMGGAAPLVPDMAPITDSVQVNGTNITLGFNWAGGTATVPDIIPGTVVTYNMLGRTGTVTARQQSTVTIVDAIPVNSSALVFVTGQLLQLGTLTYTSGAGFLVTLNVTGSITATNATQFNITGTTFTGPNGVYPVNGTVFGTGMTFPTIQSADLRGVVADMDDTSAVGIIAFRTAARMQHFGELLNFTGYRAVEFTLGFFGVKIPDERAQWPIYHGGFSMPVIFTEVLQTSNSVAQSPQGNLAGHGITGANKSMVSINVKEHCFIYALAHIMPVPQYHTILSKHLLRKTRWDIPNPIFEFVGEQPTYAEELYPNTATPGSVLGFVPRYSELSYLPSVLRGQMRSAFASWNMARLYTTQPVLSAGWRYEVPTSRTMAVTTEDQFQVDFGFICRAVRPFRGQNSTAGIHIV